MAGSRTLLVLVLSGLGACALENPQVIVPPTNDVATDVGAAVDVAEPIDRPTPVDLGIAVDVVTAIDRPPTVDLGVDAGRDAGVVDTGPMDAGVMDVGVPDAGVPDTGVLDVGVPDVGSPDVGVPDVPVVVDSGTVDVPLDPTCGSNMQRCCAGAMSCRSGLTCVNPGVAFCTPCGGDFQLCCGGGACNRGPCRGGFCTVF